MNARKHAVIKTAEFNPDVRKYWLLSGTLVLGLTLFGIPLIPFWYLFGMWITGRSLARMECILTEKTLIVRKGVFNRIEKTVPLDKITDLGMIEGPVMRFWNIQSVSVETAGQSGPGSLIKLQGIVDAEGFRDDVLAQRDVLLDEKKNAPQLSEKSGSSDETVELLKEIRDLLRSQGAHD